jgi:hypothetical protein
MLLPEWGHDLGSHVLTTPNADCRINKEWSHTNNLLGILLWIENCFQNFTIDVLDCFLRWGSHIDSKEMPLQPMWNIILSTSWLKHSTNELKVLNGFEETPLIFGEEVESFMLNELTSDFQSDLITPCVDEGH